jgi:hypothetical protein
MTASGNPSACPTQPRPSPPRYNYPNRGGDRNTRADRNGLKARENAPRQQTRNKPAASKNRERRPNQAQQSLRPVQQKQSASQAIGTASPPRINITKALVLPRPLSRPRENQPVSKPITGRRISTCYIAPFGNNLPASKTAALQVTTTHSTRSFQTTQRVWFQLRPRQARIKESYCHNQRQPYNGRVATAGAEHGSSRKQGPPAANQSWPARRCRLAIVTCFVHMTSNNGGERSYSDYGIGSVSGKRSRSAAHENGARTKDSSFDRL